ncbi:MAG TPA: hypothetical protein VFU97_24450 [Xanthobacteraceae bacterium]|nr:hypothetical protein [Xanthobacteraceae bacterium]
MRKRAEVNPISAGVGKVAGYFAPGAAAKVLKGAGALGRAAEVAAAPLEALSGAGSAAERVAAGIVGQGAKSLAGRVAQAAIPAAVRGGLEGAAVSTGDAISEQALGPDHELTAEKVMTAAADGFGVGALLGGGLGAAGAAAGTAKNAVAERLRSLFGPRDVESLAERQFGEAAPGLGDAWVKMSATLSGKDPEAIRALGIQNLTPEAREARSIAAFEGEHIRDESARAIRENIDELNAASRRLQEEYMGGLKAEHVERNIEKGETALALQREQAQGQLGAVRESLDRMLADKDAYGQVADLRKLDRHLNVAEREVADAFAAGKNGQAYVALDNFKKRLGKLAKPGTFLTTSSDMAVTGEARELYEGLRQSLEDEAIWGKTALDQQRINGAWSKYLDTKRLFEQRLSTELGRDPANPWVRQLTADPAKIEAYVNGLTAPRNDLVHQTIKDHLANSRSLADAIGQLNDLPVDKVADLGRIYRSSDAFDKTVEKAEKSLVLTNQLRSLEASDHGGISAITGGLGGLALGGPLGAALGVAAGALTHPGQAIRQLAAIERLATKTDKLVDGSLKELAKSAISAGREASAATARGALRATTAQLADDDRDPHNVYAQTTEQLARASQSPEATQGAVQAMIGPEMAREAPNVSSTLTQRNYQALQFLQAKAPQTFGGSAVAPQARKPKPPDSEVSKYARYVRAVQDPRTIVTAIGKGTPSIEQGEVLRSLAPKLHQELTTKIVMHVGKLASEGKTLPYAKRIRLSAITGVPLDRTMDPAMIGQLQSLHQQMRKSGGGGPGGGAPRAPKRKLEIADRHESRVEQILGGG